MRALACLSALLLAAPAIPQTILPIPVDLIARARFPHDDPKIVDTLAFINVVVNHMIRPVTDKAHYGRAELWVMYPPDNKGDCEDYALTKLGILSDAGFPTVAYARIRGVIVGKSGGHALLEVRLPSGAVMELDSRYQEPMTRRQLQSAGYQFFDW